MADKVPDAVAAVLNAVDDLRANKRSVARLPDRVDRLLPALRQLVEILLTPGRVGRPLKVVGAKNAFDSFNTRMLELEQAINDEIPAAHPRINAEIEGFRGAAETFVKGAKWSWRALFSGHKRSHDNRDATPSHPKPKRSAAAVSHSAAAAVMPGAASMPAAAGADAGADSDAATEAANKVSWYVRCFPEATFWFGVARSISSDAENLGDFDKRLSEAVLANTFVQVAISNGAMPGSNRHCLEHVFILLLEMLEFAVELKKNQDKMDESWAAPYLGNQTP
ncbi:hypothetical protein M885DRAFT_576282 [Pelagophyceae sp. CCMP2097]|nr:hypothetical protein M885DRAFT_576282 [Pelagophyceae sp. CCMP2097]